MHMNDVEAPDTLAARGALSLAEQYYSPAMMNHVRRSWYLAEALAAAGGHEDVDHELLYVAALLHDIGLAPEFDNHTISYEHAGGHVGIALTAGAGWSPERRRRVLDVVVHHNWTAVDPAVDLEGHLLELATALDVTGTGLDALPWEFVEELTRALPRGSFAEEFSRAVAEQAARKPDTAAARIAGNDLAGRMRRHPLETT